MNPKSFYFTEDSFHSHTQAYNSEIKAIFLNVETGIVSISKATILK